MRVRLKTWATHKLKTGDLTALASMANGRGQFEPQRVRRLLDRGFVSDNGNGDVAVTARGRIALAIKRLTTFA